MAKIKNENKGFGVYPLALINDDTLTDRARFLYIYMSAKPDYWDFYLDNIAKSLHLGRDTVQKYIKELIDAGWLEKGDQQNNNGKFGAVEYVLKAIKSKVTVDEKNRYGKIPLQNNSTINSPINNISTINSPDKENNNKESISKSRFQKPTIEQIDAYIKEKKLHFDAQDYYDYYESVGWVVGKSGKRMKDWKATCRTWENNRKVKDQGKEEKEESVTLPEGMTIEMWTKCKCWLTKYTPRISGFITPDCYMEMKELANDTRTMTDIIRYIEDSGFCGDMIKEFQRLLITGEYKEEV